MIHEDVLAYATRLVRAVQGLTIPSFLSATHIRSIHSIPFHPFHSIAVAANLNNLINAILQGALMLFADKIAANDGSVQWALLVRVFLHGLIVRALSRSRLLISWLVQVAARRRVRW